MIKVFYNEKNDTMYKTLKEAKAACKWPKVYRAWVEGGYIIDMELVYAFGEMANTILGADKKIESRMKGKGL